MNAQFPAPVDAAETPQRPVVLIGPMAAGKSFLALHMSKFYGYDFVDADQVIVSRYGVISKIFAEHGEKYFRDLEADTVAEILRDPDHANAIFSVGGGAPMTPSTRELLRHELGSYVHWDRRLDSRLAGALMGIQAIKGVEVGDGFLTAARPGSEAHDEISRGADGAVRRVSNRAGGIEGGMSIGDVLRVRAAMKPIATVPKALRTVDVATGEAARAHHQRSDVCAVPAAGVVAEAMVALVLADAVTEKFGGDSITETARNKDAYLAAIPESLHSAGELGAFGDDAAAARDDHMGDPLVAPAETGAPADAAAPGEAQA